MKQSNEQVPFIGLANLKTDIELLNTKVTLFKLRYLICDVLQLNPLMMTIENQLFKE